MLDTTIVLTALAVAGYLAFSPRLAGSSGWRATVTPLASIMGSGFLISAPLLAGIVGNLAVVFMALLLLVAYLVGEAIRFNIRHFEPIENAGTGPAQDVAFLSRVILAGAYFISISYYLQLLSAFVLSILGIESQLAAHGIASFLLIAIGGIGMWRGLQELEAIEKYAVSLNLGVIAALLVGLSVENAHRFLAGTWSLPAVSSAIDFHDLRVLLGLLIIVQGFETSRYLGDEHPAEQRVATMRRAQILSAAIYLVFIGLATVLFHGGLGADVTAIIGMIRPVAVVLPILIVIAAIGSQFSAAVADDAGSGGLIEDITHRRVPLRLAYLLILAVTLAVTWETDVNRIIAYASRAFALFYLLQCLVAFLVARRMADLPGRGARLALFAGLTVVCLLVSVLGLPSE